MRKAKVYEDGLQGYYIWECLTHGIIIYPSGASYFIFSMLGNIINLNEKLAGTVLCQ